MASRSVPRTAGPRCPTGLTGPELRGTWCSRRTDPASPVPPGPVRSRR
ncbi:hypothetical protein ACFFX0_16395 [Citricoccus parietis]|uniref:Uncharacterized protein n=1 Tax=Citricoccus parietis TaxID=592307 RepID=A0ABV5G185_9MICC